MIQPSQNSSTDIIGQTTKISYVTKWELKCHEIVAISNHAKLMNLKKHYAKHNLYHRELIGNRITVTLILPRRNPCTASINEVVSPDITPSCTPVKII